MTNPIEWGDAPYDHMTPAEVVHSFAVERGDLSEQYARDQLALWIERYAKAQSAENDARPCKGRNANVCVAEGCYSEACTRVTPPVETERLTADEIQRLRGFKQDQLIAVERLIAAARAENDAPAVPYGPGWHHHNAGHLHRNGACSTCPIPPRSDRRRGAAMSEQSADYDATLTTAERYRLLAATHLDTSPDRIAERVLEGRDTAVVEAVEAILRERLTRVIPPAVTDS